MQRARHFGAAWLDRLRGLSSEDLPRLLALMGLFFLVVCAVGILRPIKNSLALDGLGSSGFYKVYLVSAVVVLFVPAFTALAGRLSWSALFSGVAFFFAANLVVFRVIYVEGSAAFGLVFYGWYDLFAAALVTQFFMATQFYFNARSAKQAYPMVIAGGSIGATLGGAITGFSAEVVGTPNLLLVAAALITVFALCIPWVLRGADTGTGQMLRGGKATAASRGTAKLGELIRDRHVLLIAGTVLLTIVVKQLVDYQFNAITKDVFVTLDAVSSFQGKFNAATQWLPLVVLAGLRPALRRWGIGAAVLLLPALMLLSTVALAITFGLIAAVMAKGAETSLRYSAERAGREILYVPLREEIKMSAKAYIDVALEKGLGKVVSALIIMLLLQFMGYRQIAWVAAGLSVFWLLLALSVRREYVTTLARSIEGRFASLQGTFASLLDASTLPVLRRALDDASPLRTAFGLELLGQMPADEMRPLAPELNRLLGHDRTEIRTAALDLLVRIPDVLDADAAERLLVDGDPAVRSAAVRALLARSKAAAPALLNRLLRHESAGVRTAALTAVLGADGTQELRLAGRAWVQERWTTAPRDEVEAREELALAAGTLHGDADADLILAPFLDDDDPRVRSTALRSAGLLGRADLCPRMIAALGEHQTRDAARDALVSLGTAALEPLAAALLDEQAPASVRRAVPRTLVHIPGQATVDALLRLVIAPETDQLLDVRALKALSKLRARHPELRFDVGLVSQVADRDCDAAAHYMAVRQALPGTGTGVEELLRRALDEGFAERREGVFRCLGMIHPSEQMHRAFNALTAGTPSQRANAVEWIEQTVGNTRFARLAAVLEPVAAAPAGPADVASLGCDGDSWIALLARAFNNPTETGMELIEKVLLLQQIDLLRGARGTHAALLGSIAEEVDVETGTVLIAAGEPPAAMFIVTRGEVELSGVGQRLVIQEEGAFGTWALIDDQPSPVEARAVRQTHLLRITREDFHDLLADHSELAVGLLQGLARRMRSLVA